jgi:L-ribulose-5-phosphate 3-epimerase
MRWLNKEITDMGIAFMTANFVAKEINYSGKQLLEEWGQCHEITLKSFHGPDFKDKFESLIGDISQLGFNEIELWNAHFEPLIITDWQLNAAVEILKNYNMKVVGLYTDAFRDRSTTIEVGQTIFQAAKELGANKIIQSGKPLDERLIVTLCEQYDMYFGIENHPEKDSEELLEMIRPFSPRIGACIDTGWFATQGGNAAEIVKALQGHTVHIHLKDILAAGEHETCTLGDGIVDIKGIIQFLKVTNYQGTLSIEHEPIDYDPTNEIKNSLFRVNQWLDVEVSSS